MNPTGGLARRQTVVKAAKGALVLDSGNALFSAPGLDDAKSKTRAAFILQAMADLGTRAMAVGARDLNAGPEWLKQQGARAKVAVLSANLQRGDKALFDAAVMLDVGGVKVGVIGVSPMGPLAGQETVIGRPALHWVRQALPAVQGADVRIVLAAMPYNDAMALGLELKNEVDVVIQSHEGRGTLPAQKLAGAFLLASGLRGQAVGQLDLKLGKTGALLDEAESGREKQQLDFLDNQVTALEARLKKTKNADGRAQLEQTLSAIRMRRRQQQQTVDDSKSTAERTFSLTWKTLGGDVRDDAAMKARVLKIDPAYVGAH